MKELNHHVHNDTYDHSFGNSHKDSMLISAKITYPTLSRTNNQNNKGRIIRNHYFNRTLRG